MFKKHISSRKIITVLLVLLSIVLIVVLPFVIYGNETTAENVSYFAQIVSSIFVIAGVIIAVWQYYITSRSEICKIQTDNIRKAIDLAEYYKDNILDLHIRIKAVYSQVGILKILDSVHTEKMKDFDSSELKEIFTTAQINELQNLSSNLAPHIDKVISNYKMSDNIKTISDKDKFLFKGILGDYIFLIKNQTMLLNNLEYFAMNFTHDTADESVVFTSLAPTYLEIVRMMYYQIARNNKGDTSKYFTNVIELYNIWNTKTKLISEKDKATRNKKYIKGTVVNPHL